MRLSSLAGSRSQHFTSIKFEATASGNNLHWTVVVLQQLSLKSPAESQDITKPQHFHRRSQKKSIICLCVSSPVVSFWCHVRKPITERQCTHTHTHTYGRVCLIVPARQLNVARGGQFRTEAKLLSQNDCAHDVTEVGPQRTGAEIRTMAPRVLLVTW